MTRLTKQWVEKAEGDFNSALRELRARKRPNYDSACFHSQQCAEKYLKARLQHEKITFPRTHNLSALLDLILSNEPAWLNLVPELRTLGAYAVEVRYPGVAVDKSMAREAVAICREVRKRVRESLKRPIETT